MPDSVWPQRQQPTRSAVPEILHARTLEWVAISFSNAWKWKVKVKSLSPVRLLKQTNKQQQSICQCRRHETWVRSPGQAGLLEEGMTIHSSISAWRTPWTEDPGRLQSLGWQSQARLKWLSTHTPLAQGQSANGLPFSYYNCNWSTYVSLTLSSKYKIRDIILSFLWSKCLLVLSTMQQAGQQIHH